MRIVTLLAQAREGLTEWLDEIEILNGPEVVRVREDQFMQDMQELALSPNLGRYINSGESEAGLLVYSVRGGYVVYDVTDTELRVALFVRDADMPDVSALLLAPTRRPQ